MAICSFLGHEDVYDADIEARLQAAVNQVVAENDTVEFLLNFDRKFFYYCLLLQKNVQKKIDKMSEV